MIIYLPLQARLNRTLDYSLLCHRLEIATERYNNNVPAKFIQQGCSILSTPPPLFFCSESTLQVKVFAWSPLSNQLFGFGETFLQIKSPAPKF